MNILLTLGVLAIVFLALPWLAIAFNRYCDVINRLITKPRNPCPSGRHHAHPMQTCDEYEQWRREIDAAIEDSPDAQPSSG